MNIVQKLSLNKHPKDVQDLSLVNAQNIKVSNDESCITNEEGIREKLSIKFKLDGAYGSDYKIVGVIPCTNELILIVIPTPDSTVADIFRYREKTINTLAEIKLVYSGLKYHGGKITGTFTYNVENSLVLAISEYDVKGENIPLKTINLGNFDDNSIPNDKELKDEQLSLVPEVKIPSINSYKYLAGASYKGWYFIFIRYKINTVDYTQWYNFGTPIYLDNLITKQLVRENFYTDGNTSGYNDGFSDSISEDLDICNKTFNIDIDTNIFKDDYNTYQLGFVCCTKTYIKVWRSNDINSSNQTYTLNNSNLIEDSLTNFTDTHYNYFNVKNLINYKNRLYISNFNEQAININDEELIDIANNVNILGKIKKIANSNINYINKLPELTNANFTDRCNQTTLIPDGVYNFYIHYIDKYGHATKGYKLNPKSNINDFIDKYAVIIPVVVKNVPYYFPCKITDTFKDYFSNKHDTRTVLVYDSFVDGNLGNPKEISIYDITEALNNILYDYKDPLYEDLYISQVVNNSVTNDSNFNFGVTINSNGDYLFRVPQAKTKLEDEITYLQYKLEVEVPQLPNGFIGYYISYEEYEANAIVTGYLTKRNANVGGTAAIPDNNLYYKENTKTMCFYSSKFDIEDSIKFKYNALKIENTIWETEVSHIIHIDTDNAMENNDYVEYPNRANIYYDINDTHPFSYVAPIYPIFNYKLGIANDNTTSRIAKGTAVLIDFDKDLTGGAEPSFVNYVFSYIATLYNYRNDIYTSRNKKLVRLTDYIYNTEKQEINYGYNGVLTYDGVIIYNDNGYVLSASTNDNKSSYKSITVSKKLEYLPDGIDKNRIHPVSYVTYPVYDTYFHESKVINNPPKIYYNFIEDSSKENAKIWPASFVEPINSIDLFKNPQGSISDFHPVTNINYTEDTISVTEFNKTVRRSNVIQDETRINAWRQFPIEGYKNITENKGQITNIVGIGSMFLVHTEHSLFMFDTNNMLKTLNTEVQLSQPDAFEVDYKEVFTSDLGFGGLQDKDSAIIDQFGYIFYNNDSNRLYQFDNGQLANIDDDIVEWLLKSKPYNVRFANDKQNNRLLIKMEYDTNNSIILSYNYNVKAFISRHTYHFDKAYNTKNELYLQCDNNHTGCSLHTFVRNANNFGSFDNTKQSMGTVVNNDSKLNIIINPNYENIKYLETISYKITKIIDAKYANPGSIVQDNRYIKHFSGNKLRVYNNLTDTRTLDVYVEDDSNKNMFANFDKPYWYLGVWNYNYFRNTITTANTTSSDLLSRIIGNYFIIEFTFTNEDNMEIEFEGLTYNVTQ